MADEKKKLFFVTERAGGPLVRVAGSPHSAELCLGCEGGPDESSSLVALWGLDGLLARPLVLLRAGPEDGRLTTATFAPW